MKNLTKILVLSSAIALNSSCYNRITKLNEDKNYTFEQTEQKEIILPDLTLEMHFPFKTLNEIEVSSDSTQSNEKAKEFLERTIQKADSMYNKEREIKEKYADLIKENEKEKYDFLKKETISEKEKEFYKEMQRFGKGLLLKESKLCYNPELSKKLIKLGLKPTDCITYILESMTKGNNKNYNLETYSDAEGLARLLKKLNFETIYFAENTTKTDKKYQYNIEVGYPSYTKDFLKKIKKKEYLTKIDYLVTDNDFHNPLFEKFLKEQKGFLIIQERHVGFLSEGNLLECHIATNPINSELYSKTDLKYRMSNKNPLADYQSAVLFVPKGTVQNFIYNNSLDKLE